MGGGGGGGVVNTRSHYKHCLNLKNCFLCFVATIAMPGMNVIFYAPLEMFKKKLERRPYIGDPAVNLAFLNNKLRTPTKQRRFLQVKFLILVHTKVRNHGEGPCPSMAIFRRLLAFSHLRN